MIFYFDTELVFLGITKTKDKILHSNSSYTSLNTIAKSPIHFEVLRNSLALKVSG
jgi:hypothetical protein